MQASDYERASEMFNRCQAQGAPAANIDYLICALAERIEIPVLTPDPDFEWFARLLPVKLAKPRM